jgi:aryl-alcohol dehydrogenase-like predicted oxidoreductase
MFQGYGDVDQSEALATLHAALNAGVILFDTAMGYGAGGSERLLAVELASRREEVVLATKLGVIRDGADVRVDARPEHVWGFLEASRKWRVGRRSVLVRRAQNPARDAMTSLARMASS